MSKRRVWPGGLEVNVAGITPATPIGELTTGQFVEVLAAVLRQTPTSRAVDPEDLQRVIQQIRTAVGSLGGKPTALQQGVRDAQAAILARMPEVAQQAAADLNKKR